MRKIQVVALVMALVMLVTALPLTAFAAKSKTMYVKTEDGLSLNVRSSKKTKADNVITHLAYGTKVTVLSESGSWARITWGSKSTNKGYVMKKYLSSKQPQSTTVYRFVKTPSKIGVNVRTSRSSTATILGIVPEGKRVKVLATYSGGWSKIVYKDLTGYVYSRYLSVAK